MVDYSDGTERFVETPGIVEIRVISDDPDFFAEPEDLFDKQGQGLPERLGVKNKMTREQVFFNCNICECELKSVVTLRAHCRGTQHVRKALQKKKEYRKAQFNKEKEGDFEAACLSNATNTRRKPEEPASSKRETFEEESHQRWKRRREHVGTLGELERENRGRKSEEYSWRVERADRDRRVQGCHLRSLTGPCPSLDDQKENVRGFMARFESRRVIEYKMDTSSRVGQEETSDSGREDWSKLSNDSSCGSEEAFHGIEELCRRGDFANWKTTMVKKEGLKRGEEEPKTKTLPPAVERDEDEEIQRLHSKVRDTVCYHLNHYWPEAKEYLGESKFKSRADYSSLARDFSHRLRDLIKESYFTLHGTLKGIVLTPDHKVIIKAEVEMLMEKLPTLNRL